MATTATRKKLDRNDYRIMVDQNLADLDALVGDLDPADWDQPSLCEGWRVRDVVGHLLLGTTVSIPRVVGKVVAGGGRLDHVVGRASCEIGSSYDSATLHRMLGDELARPKLGGVAGKTSPKVLAADTLTHVLDVSLAVDRPSGIDSERLARALDLLPKLGKWGTKKRAKGLRLVATDIDWSHGEGPEVRATAEELIVSLGGRPQFAHRLAGSGASTLVERIGGRT